MNHHWNPFPCRSSWAFLLAFFIFSSLSAQNYAWSHSFGDVGQDAGQALATDGAHVYFTGYFTGAADLDPGPWTTQVNASGSRDVFIAKVDSAGGGVWGASVGGGSVEEAHDIAVGDSGQVFVAGTFIGTGDFDPGPGVHSLSAAGGEDAFLLKLDDQGKFQWAISFGGAFADGFRAVELAEDGAVWVAGYFEDSVDFDPGPAVDWQASAGGSDACLLKLDANGNVLWSGRFGGSGPDKALGLAKAPSAAVLLCGEFSDSLDFDPGPNALHLSSNGLTDAFVLRLLPNGSLDWAKAFGSSGADDASATAVDRWGNVHCTGTFDADMDADPSPGGTQVLSPNVGVDAYVQKLDANGDFLWAGAWGGPISDRGKGIAVDLAGNVYCVGSFNGTADFNPGPGQFSMASQATFDGYLLKLDSSGDFTWAKQFSGTQPSSCDGIASDDLGHLYATGVFSGSIDLDPGSGSDSLSSAGSTDGFWLRLSNPNPLIGQAEAIGFPAPVLAFPNPNAGSFSIELGKWRKGVEIEIWNAQGRMHGRSHYPGADFIPCEIKGPSGLYILRARWQSGPWRSVKILKE